MIAVKKETIQIQRRTIMDTELKILVQLTDLLEKEKLLSVEERNHAVNLLEKGGTF